VTAWETFIHNQLHCGEGIAAYYEANPSPVTETLCGSGSTLDNTIDIREWLPTIIADYHIHTMLDAGCGDLHWIRHVDLGDVMYTGWDISASDATNPTFPHELHGPVNLLTVDTVPTRDLILCRDLLIHLPNEAITVLLDKFRASGSRYLLTTWCPSADNQDDCPLDGGQRWLGYFDRVINLEAHPFNFPPALASCPDSIPGFWGDKRLALYPLCP